MKNVTITLDEAVARWARIEAAKAGKSLSRFVGDRLSADMQKSGVDRAAIERYLTGPAWPSVGGALPKRDDLYDRPALLRYEPARLRSRRRRSGKKKSGIRVAAPRR
jgi:hypothetical protein